MGKKPPHNLSEPAASAEERRRVKLVLPPGWQLLVVQGDSLRVELSEFDPAAEPVAETMVARSSSPSRFP